MHYYGTRLSENISRREPEGYLLCLNVPVARSGTQEYLPAELSLPSGGAAIPVRRPEEEVFSPETVASFEGMPVTNDHPPEGVDAGNIRALQKGHAHNVRRGTGKESDLLLADLIITDPALIRLVLEEGKREISCGYTYELCLEGGQYVQRKIRGNHVAVVDAGRAGSRVSIRDARPRAETRRPARPAANTHTENERSELYMKKSLVKKLVRMAKDGDPEAMEAVAEMLEAFSGAEEAGTAGPDEPAETPAAPEEPGAVIETAAGNAAVIDGDGLAGIMERLDRIIALLAPAAADEEPGEEARLAEAVGEAVAEAVEAGQEIMPDEDLPEGMTPADVSEIVEEILDPALSVIPDPEDETDEDPCEDPGRAAAADALRAALAVVRPVLARMPGQQRRRVAADIAARMRGHTTARRASDGSTYAAIAGASRRRPAAGAELGRRIMASRNANLKNRKGC